MVSNKTIITRLRAAKTDGRTENVRYRQSQLLYLHHSLTNLQDEIRAAIRKDTSTSATEADTEFAAAMISLRNAYTSLDFDKSLLDEYSVARGQAFEERRQGMGTVYVKPGREFPFFGVLAPVAAAVAAGNCVLVQMDSDLRYLPGLIKQVFSKAVDSDAIAVVDGDVDDEAFLAEALIVDQKPNSDSPLLANELRSRTKARVVAVVDRTADVEAAAESLVRARMAFNGRSPYAPDLVIVNEFVKKRFLEAAVKQVAAYKDGSSTALDSNSNLAKQLDADANARLVASESTGSIFDVTSRSSTLLSAKISEPALLVTATSSLEDAIDYLNSTLSQISLPESTYLTSYIFAAPPTAKYLSQFIRSSASFVNHVPAGLLIGPAAPWFPQQPLAVDARYTTEMFSACSPEFVHSSESSLATDHALFGGAKGSLTASQLAERAVQPFKSTGQALQHAKIGFFEQGILIGLGTAATPILLGIGTGLYFGVRFLWQRFL